MHTHQLTRANAGSSHQYPTTFCTNFKVLYPCRFCELNNRFSSPKTLHTCTGSELIRCRDTPPTAPMKHLLGGHFSPTELFCRSLPGSVSCEFTYATQWRDDNAEPKPAIILFSAPVLQVNSTLFLSRMPLEPAYKRAGMRPRQLSGDQLFET